MKIYTRTGDAGETGLFGGARVAKTDLRVEAYGSVDEANAAIGVARAAGVSPSADRLLQTIQDELFTVGAELACAPGKEAKLRLELVDDAATERQEHAMDELEATLPPLKTFVLPGGTPGAAGLHLARTIARRAERAVLSANAESPLRPEILRYLNRLSDLLFVMARAENHVSGVADVPWKP
jgi:cob(I)alamin adenosyltransferase